MDKEQQLIKLIDWAIQKQLTWAGIFLASVVGIIELLPHIKKSSKEISIPKYALYVLLVCAIIYSTNMSARYLEEISNIEYELNEKGWDISKKHWSEFQKLLLKKNNDQEWRIDKRWLYSAYIIIIILFGSLFLDRLGII